MRNYLRIAKVYLRGPAAAVWLFMFVCLLAESVAESNGDLARQQGGVLGGIHSRKACMAMFAYFNACLLGVILRDSIAHPWASVLPHYRKKHLLVTTLIALFFLGIPMFSMELVGTSDIAPTSIAVIFLTCLAAGLWTLHHPLLGFLAFPFLAFVMVPSSSPALAGFLAGKTPATSAALVFISLLALWTFAWRLLALNEGMFDHAIARVWGDCLRGRGQTFQGQAKTIDDYLAALPADQRAALQNFDSLKTPFTNLKEVENLSGHSERSLWQRLRLWRLGTAPTRASASVGFLMLITPIFILPFVWTELPARSTVVIFSVQVMTNPFNILLFWFKRRHRLGYESLRPRTRHEFVRELGLALLWDMTLCWLGGVLFMGITAAIWAPELLQVKNIILFICCTGVGQLCAYAMMGIWSLKRGMIASISCTLCAFMALAQWMIWTMDGSIGVEVNIAIGSLLAAASVATIALAYRRWCRADLD
jgi:hypothetical protein